MRNRKKVTCMAVYPIVKIKSVRKVVLPIYTILHKHASINTFIIDQENVSIQMRTNIIENGKISFTAEKDFLEPIHIYSNQKFSDFYRTFNILFTTFHFTIITQ
jgi:hypothetical protein